MHALAVDGTGPELFTPPIEALGNIPLASGDEGGVAPYLLVTLGLLSQDGEDSMMPLIPAQHRGRWMLGDIDPAPAARRTTLKSCRCLRGDSQSTSSENAPGLGGGRSKCTIAFDMQRPISSGQVTVAKNTVGCRVGYRLQLWAALRLSIPRPLDFELAAPATKCLARPRRCCHVPESQPMCTDGGGTINLCALLQDVPR